MSSHACARSACASAYSTDTVTRTATDEAGERLVVLIILVLVVAAILYGMAYMRVNSGNMVVYSSWGDFAALKESLDELKNGRKGIVDGVLIPLGIALFVFNSLVKPMIGDRRG